MRRTYKVIFMRLAIYVIANPYNNTSVRKIESLMYFKLISNVIHGKVAALVGSRNLHIVQIFCKIRKCQMCEIIPFHYVSELFQQQNNEFLKTLSIAPFSQKGKCKQSFLDILAKKASVIQRLLPPSSLIS